MTNDLLLFQQTLKAGNLKVNIKTQYTVHQVKSVINNFSYTAVKAYNLPVCLFDLSSFSFYFFVLFVN